MDTPRVSSPLAHTVRWRCVSLAGSRSPRGSLLVSEVREHPRVLPSLISLYLFRIATRTRPNELPLSKHVGLGSRCTTNCKIALTL